MRTNTFFVSTLTNFAFKLLVKTFLHGFFLRVECANCAYNLYYEFRYTSMMAHLPQKLILRIGASYQICTFKLGWWVQWGQDEPETLKQSSEKPSRVLTIKSRTTALQELYHKTNINITKTAKGLLTQSKDYCTGWYLEWVATIFN